MDPRFFLRVSVASLALRFPMDSKVSANSVLSPCYCRIKLANLPLQTAPVPLVSPANPLPSSHTIAASFYLDEQELSKLLATSLFCTYRRSLLISVYTRRQGSSCSIRSGKLMGKFILPVKMEWAALKPVQLQNGWVCIGKQRAEGGSVSAELHLVVKVEADPRYCFQFDGHPELSPQIVQLQGNHTQPIFSCKFTQDRCSRSRNIGSLECVGNREKAKERKERKGWLIIIHDLSGSPVAAASMITPFVPSSGLDHVSRANPGAWLILRAGPVGENSWRPWGRLEAWSEGGARGRMGCRFKLAGEGGRLAGIGSDILVSESVIDTHKGGNFTIDTTNFKQDSPISSAPLESTEDICFSIGALFIGGFVMSSFIQGEGKCSKPEVQLAMRHVTCPEDAAVFMALAAAVDLSIDACLPFTKKLGKGFSFSKTLI